MICVSELLALTLAVFVGMPPNGSSVGRANYADEPSGRNAAADALALPARRTDRQTGRASDGLLKCSLSVAAAGANATGS